MVKQMTWRDLSWSTTNTKTTSTTNGVVDNSRTESSLSNTSPSIRERTQLTLSSKPGNTEKNSFLQSKETLVTSKSKNTDSNVARSSTQLLPSSSEQPPSSQQVSKSRPTSRGVSLPPKQTQAATSARLPSKRQRKAPTSHQVWCHWHAGYKHCGVKTTGQDGMVAGLVGGYAALALVVAISFINMWASKYLPFFLKMWWIKASSVQTYDVNT